VQLTRLQKAREKSMLTLWNCSSARAKVAQQGSLETTGVHRSLHFIALALVLFAAGCAVTFEEDHYFQQQNAAGDATNYFHLRVSGYGAMSSARYVSGYYDERAVDLFFNELKVEQTSQTTNTQLFKDAQTDPGSSEIIKPLDPGVHGAFVMILSTNASSVARTIGQFAENQIVADAITNLMNRDALLSKSERIRSTTNSANATATEIARLMGFVNSDAPIDREANEKALLRVLSTIATDVGGAPRSFASLTEAEAWFALHFKGSGNP
jgi:hypothetical protein